MDTPSPAPPPAASWSSKAPPFATSIFARVGGERVAPDAAGDLLRLAVREGEAVQDGRPAAASVHEGAGGRVEQVPVDRAQAAVVVRRDRERHDALAEAVEVDRDGGLLGPGALVGALGRSVVVLTANGDRVVLGREEGRDVLAQGEGEDARAAVARVVPLEVGDLRRVVAVRQIEEVVAAGSPGRRPGGGEVGGHLAQLAGARAPDVDALDLGLVARAEGEVRPVR